MTMSRKYKFHNPEGLYFVTLTVRKWVDVFTRNEYKNILIENLCYCQKNRGLDIFTYCIMTNHAHLIVSAKEGYNLSDIIRDFKKFTSRTILNKIRDNSQESRREWILKEFRTDKGYSLWQTESRPIKLWDNKVIEQKIDYIHYNPVEEGFVFNPEDYMYSSAYDYAGGKGMLDIEVIG